MLEPFLAEQADVPEHPVERPLSAHRVGAILEHTRRPDFVRRFVELRQRRAGRHVLVELLVVQLTAGKCLLTQQFRQLEPRAGLYTAFMVRGLLM